MPNVADMDRRARAVMARAKGEPCTWVPKRRLPHDQEEYTVGVGRPDDPSRPRVDGLVAIVTWKNNVGEAGPGGDNRLASAQVMVDLAAEDFPNGIPVKGDQFILPEQDPGERLMEVGRAFHDGSARIFALCKVVT